MDRAGGENEADCPPRTRVQARPTRDPTPGSWEVRIRRQQQRSRGSRAHRAHGGGLHSSSPWKAKEIGPRQPRRGT